ncbi:MAG: hypothetical protein RIT43_1451 [Bacteroidota bacterium]
MYADEISIIGTGNVAFKLGEAFQSAGIKVKEIYSRNSAAAHELAKITQSLVVNDPLELSAKLLLICVSDEEIHSVINKLPLHKKVVYTSGSVSLKEFVHRKKIGVFYPLQTLRKDQPIRSGTIPVLVESENEEFVNELLCLGKKISSHVVISSSEERLKYHLAAVWLNNFTNHMASISRTIIDENELEYEILLPLLEETVQKLLHEHPFDSQTGPARRRDDRILTLHASLLQGTRKEMYEVISKSISETYHP